VTPNTPLLAISGDLSFVHYYTSISQHTTLEVPSFTDSTDMIGAKFEQTGHVTLTTPIRGECHPKAII